MTASEASAKHTLAEWESGRVVRKNFVAERMNGILTGSCAVVRGHGLTLSTSARRGEHSRTVAGPPEDMPLPRTAAIQ